MSIVDGNTSDMPTKLTHFIPAGPVLLTPSDGSTVDPKSLIFSWEPVKEDLNGAAITIVGYPDKKLAGRLILELIKMGMLEKQLKNTFDLNKRKEMLQQFFRSKKAIEYWVSRFENTNIRKPQIN